MKNFWQLTIDTSGPESSVALHSQDRSYCRSSVQQISHNQVLFLLVESLFEEAKISLGDLQLIVVGSGPGSFTGLRVSYAYAKGISFALRIPLISISSLKAAAAASSAPLGTPIVVISDARREEAFCGTYTLSDGGVAQAIGSEKIIALSEISPLLARLSEETGRSAELLSFQSELLPVSRCAGSTVKDVALGLARIAQHEWLSLGRETPASEWSLTHLAELSPNYIRAVSAKTIAERLEIGS